MNPEPLPFREERWVFELLLLLSSSTYDLIGFFTTTVFLFLEALPEFFTAIPLAERVTPLLRQHCGMVAPFTLVFTL